MCRVQKYCAVFAAGDPLPLDRWHYKAGALNRRRRHGQTPGDGCALENDAKRPMGRSMRVFVVSVSAFIRLTADAVRGVKWPEMRRQFGEASRLNLHGVRVA